MSKPTCETCKHWRGKPGDMRGPCAIGYGAPAFNDTCAEHEAPAPNMQSQARGVPMGGKP